MANYLSFLTTEKIRRTVFEPLTTFRDGLTPISAILGVKESNGDLLLLTGDTCGLVCCYKAETKVKQWELKFSSGILGFISFKPDQVLVHSRDGTIRKIVLSSPLVDEALFKCAEYSFCPASRLDGLICVPSLHNNEFVDIWQVDQTCQLVVEGIHSNLEKHGTINIQEELINLLFLFVGYDDGVLVGYYIHDIEKGHNNSFEEILRLKILPQTITCLAYSEDRDALVIGGPHTDLVLIQHPFSTSERVILRSKMANEGFSSVAFSPSGKTIISGGWDGKIRFFNADDLAMRGLSNAHNDTILQVSVLHLEQGLPDPIKRSVLHHELLLVGSQDKTASIWSIYQIELLL